FITVEVGPDHTQHWVHKALLTHHSEYFRNALKGLWQEAVEGLVRLEDVEPCAFNIPLDWIYTGKLPGWSATEWLKAGDIDINDAKDWPEIVTQTILLMFRSCVLGDQLLAPFFHQAVNNLYVTNKASATWPYSYKSVVFGFANLPEHSPI
ncbi:hypothetical protein K458DRAFT_268145, partial [Lentithecium fluviatile CBS 122367]